MAKTRNCFKFMTGLAKLLVCFPVSENDNNITLQWYSFKTLCSFVFFLLSLMQFLFSIWDDAFKYAYTVFAASGMVIQISFLIVAMNWSKIIQECEKIDFYMKNYGFPKNLKLKLYAVCAILLTLFLGVYVLLDIHLSADPTFGMYTFIGIYKAFTKLFIQDKYFAMGCKVLLRFALKLSHLQVAMLRCCADIFIITVSVILAMRLRQIAERIDLQIQRKVRDRNVWMRTREDFQRLFMFCEKFDDVLGYLVLASFMSNIYCLLFFSTDFFSVSETIDQIFLTLSTTENIFRCLITLYTAGNVYEESRELVRLLILTPSDVFNDEIERMILQIRLAQPVLTGKQLFTVKHSLALQILGGVATHEIILLQYYTPNKH